MVERSQDWVANFQNWILRFYEIHGRHDLPWRRDNSVYEILVSEIMLQQTQVDRVIPKYEQFLSRFPHVEDLAAARLEEVLGLWMGLGYNRRAKYLHYAALEVMNKWGGKFPEDPTNLQLLPGIGPYTSGAVTVFGYNKPAVLLETNVRQVYLYHFLAGKEHVGDKELHELVEFTMEEENPRVWYWALMDYGSVLKKLVGNHSVRSKMYTKQSRFEGSDRQLRAKILRLLLEEAKSAREIEEVMKDERTSRTIEVLEKEGMIGLQDGVWRIKS